MKTQKIVPVLLVMFLAVGWIHAAAPYGFVRQFIDNFQRDETCSDPGDNGLGDAWTEEGSGGEPCIWSADLKIEQGDRAHLPQGGAVLVYEKTATNTRGAYAEAMFSAVDPINVYQNVDVEVRLTAEGYGYVGKLQHEPIDGPRIQLRRGLGSGLSEEWVSFPLGTEYPPLSQDPYWLRIQVKDNTVGKPVVKVTVAWENCNKSGPGSCSKRQEFSEVDEADSQGLAGTAGGYSLSSHHREYYLHQFNAGSVKSGGGGPGICIDTYELEKGACHLDVDCQNSELVPFTDCTSAHTNSHISVVDVFGSTEDGYPLKRIWLFANPSSERSPAYVTVLNGAEGVDRVSAAQITINDVVVLDTEHVGSDTGWDDTLVLLEPGANQLGVVNLTDVVGALTVVVTDAPLLE